MRFFVSSAAVLLALMSVSVFAGAARADEIVTLQTREGVTQRFALLVSDKPVASVILFTGGPGKAPLGKLQPGEFVDKGNFLIRIRYELQGHGLTVAVVDAPSDRQDNAGMYGTFRGSDEHARDIAAVIDDLKKRAAIPVWLVGTSAGTASVAALSTKLGSRIDGAVLTSSISTRQQKGFNVFQFSYDAVRAPVLVVAHRDDGCPHSPPTQADNIAAKFSASPRKKVLLFDGGNPPQGDSCEPYSQHGFFGIEKQVAAAIADFIKER